MQLVMWCAIGATGNNPLALRQSEQSGENAVLDLPSEQQGMTIRVHWETSSKILAPCI